MRRFFAQLHLWLSIPFGIIITVVCWSGALLVFETEILELCYPSRYFVKEVKGEPLAPDVLILSAQRQLPDSVKVNGLRVFSDPERTYQLVLPGKKAVGFIDPYTGKVTGWEDGKGFFWKTMRLHRWLLDSYKREGGFSWGKAIVGYATMALVIVVISGLVIWYPRNRKVLKNRLTIKTRTGWRRFWYDLHVSGGFYTTVFLLLMALTGLTWSFGWYRNAFYTLFGVDTKPSQVHQTLAEKKPHRPDYAQWTELLSTLQSRYATFNSITIQNGTATVSHANWGNTRGSDRFAFDPATGKITSVQLYKDQPDSGKIRGWIYSVHVGSWGGMTTRIISFLVALLGGILPLTGYYLWIYRTFASVFKERK